MKKIAHGIDFEMVRNTCNMIKKEVGKVIVGYEDVVDDFLVCLITQGHMFMFGVPGIAKTTLAKTFATVTGLSWNRVQFTQDLLPSDIIGHYYYNQKSNMFELRKGPIFNKIILADEINRAPPKTQSALIEAMQEQQVTLEGDTLELPQPFIVVATQNPIEYEGTFPLPEAQLDRFIIKLRIGYPNPEEEQEIRILNLRRSLATAQARVQELEAEVEELRERRVALEKDRTERMMQFSGILSRVGVAQEGLRHANEALEQISETARKSSS